MRYNFSQPSKRPYGRLIGIWILLTCWLLIGFNLFFPSLFIAKKPEITIQKTHDYPVIKSDILNFLNQLSSLDIRLLSADIYPQEIIVKGLSFNAYHFLEFLKNINKFSNISKDELLDWHRRRDGSWYFCLRMIFKA